MDKEIETHYEIFRNQAMMKELKLLARMKNASLVEADSLEDMYKKSKLSEEPYESFERDVLLREIHRMEKKFQVSPSSKTTTPFEAYKHLLIAQAYVE